MTGVLSCTLAMVQEAHAGGAVSHGVEAATHAASAVVAGPSWAMLTSGLPILGSCSRGYSRPSATRPSCPRGRRCPVWAASFATTVALWQVWQSHGGGTPPHPRVGLVRHPLAGRAVASFGFYVASLTIY
ncbi:MAG: hypothetical protein R3B49_02485 [Phycisphaerales bacterium]